MQIRTIWAPAEANDEMPWLVDAVDEYTIDANDGLPESYTNSLKPGYRELIINVSDEAVLKIFRVPATKGTTQE